MFCTACGTKNGPDSNYCKQCGHRLEKPTQKISETDFARALPEDEQVNALLERAYQLRKEGDLGAAIGLCREAAQLRPESTSAHSLLGRLYERQGDRMLALQEYERVLELNPGSIADRVKLDELRGDGIPTEHANGVHPHIVIAERGPNATPARRGLALALVTALFLLMGGALALQLQTKTRPSGPPNTRLASAVNTGVPAPVHSAAGSKEGATTAQSSTATGGISFINPYPPIYFTSPPQPAKTVYVRQSPPPTTPATVHPNASRLPANVSSKESGDRVVLGESDKAGASGDEVTIQVPNGPTGKGGSNDPGIIAEMHMGTDKNPNAKGSDSSAPSSATSGQAHSQIAIGNQNKLSGNYTQAIKAYQMALDNGSDDADRAYCYQAIGQCFQYKGDKASAVNNYTKAIDLYNGMKTAKQKVEEANSGIRSCQAGIKACGP